MNVIAQVKETDRSAAEKLTAERFQEFGCTTCHQIAAGKLDRKESIRVDIALYTRTGQRRRNVAPEGSLRLALIFLGIDQGSGVYIGKLM